MKKSILAAVIVAGGLVALLFTYFWRALPPLVPSARATAAAGKPFAGVPALPSVLSRPKLAQVRAAVLVEPENIRVTSPGEYDLGVKLWREHLRDAGAVLVAPEQAEVLIVPGAQCLGPVQRRQIAAHLARGGGVVTTGAVGVFDGLCGPLPDTLLSALVGLKDADIKAAPRRRDKPAYFITLGETVLGAHLPPGTRIEIRPGHDIVFRHAERELLYADWERTPLPVGGRYFDAAAVRALTGNGRVVALGFNLAALADDWSRDAGRMIATNAVEWAAGRHIFHLAPWPNGKQAAAVLAHDVEADYHNARLALEALEPYGLPGTAFIVGKLAQADPVTTRGLMNAMEIGTHTHNHYPLDTLSEREHLRELERSMRLASEITGRRVVGMRPPEERYTPRTLQVWADLGGDYVFASNNGRAAAPEIIPMLPDSLVLLGRVAEDDFEILSRDKMRDREAITKLLMRRVSESVAYRGLFMFSYHSHMFSQKELIPVLVALAKRLKGAREIWTTTAGEVAAWWRGRAALRLEPEIGGRSTLVTNDGTTTMRDIVVIVEAPNGGRRTLALPPIGPGARMRVDASGGVTTFGVVRR